MTRRLAVTLSLLLVVISAPAQQTEPGTVPAAKDRLTATDLFNIQYAQDPQISPDGRRMVYVRAFADIMTDRNYSNLWAVNPDGSDNRPLTTGSHQDTSPRWSPDGTRLAYVSDLDGHSQIYVRWMDSGQTARVTSLQFAPSGLAWSPDGKEISFAANVPAKPVEVGTLPKAPTGAKWEEAPTVYNRPIYRFNGVGYIKPGYTQIFVVSAEGGTPRQITSGEFQHGGMGNRASEAVWTPDSKSLLISANRHPDYELNPADTEVYEFSVADGSVRQLTDRRGPDGAPEISPDGRYIAYTGYDDKFQGYQVTRLYVMDHDGKNPRLLSGSLDRDVRNARWAPDSNGIYFAFDDEGNTKLGLFKLDGSYRQLADHVGSGGSAYASAPAFSVAKNGTLVTTYTSATDPGDIAVALRGGIPRVITQLNRDLLAQRKLGKVESFWFESSKDTRKIEGWTVKPPDFAPGQRYPTILEIHGGPFANYGERFDIEKQILAAHGYLVVYINPRGSTSYGEQFGNLIHHAYPGDDFYDLNSAIDAVVARGDADPNQLFVAGGSGGGVLTCWMIDRTTRFRAAASLYPVIDWYSFALTSDIPVLVTKYWFPGPPWEFPDQYAKRSVISLVKNVKTPTMLMTGESDYRTPISQAEEYFEALQLLKIPSVLVRVPDEPHGISRHPSHHVAKISYVMNWFDHYRQTTPATSASADQ